MQPFASPLLLNCDRRVVRIKFVAHLPCASLALLRDSIACSVASLLQLSVLSSRIQRVGLARWVSLQEEILSMLRVSARGTSLAGWVRFLPCNLQNVAKAV